MSAKNSCKSSSCWFIFFLLRSFVSMLPYRVHSACVRCQCAVPSIQRSLPGSCCDKTQAAILHADDQANVTAMLCSLQHPVQPAPLPSPEDDQVLQTKFS